MTLVVFFRALEKVNAVEIYFMIEEPVLIKILKNVNTIAFGKKARKCLTHQHKVPAY